MSRPNSPSSPLKKVNREQKNASSRTPSVSPTRQTGRSPSPSRRPTSPSNDQKAVNTSPSRSKTTKKFSESDFENKRESIDPELRKKQLQAKIRGLKLEPKEWTRVELFEKMANIFNIIYENSLNASTTAISSPVSSPSKANNVVSEIHVLNGMKLTNDEILVFNEFCRRNTEIKIINLSNAGITDDYITAILQGCKQVKCILWLNLNKNFLTMVGLEAIIRAYSQANQHRKRLEKLTLQGNLQLTYENGYQFIQSFLTIEQINTIPIKSLKQNHKEVHSWDLCNQEIRSFELGMICYLLKQFLSHIKEILLAKNHLTSKNLHQLLDVVTRSLPHCHTLDLSQNNITNNGYDLSAIEKLQRFVANSKQLRYVFLEEIPELPKPIYENIQRSCAINRSLDRSENNLYFFNDYLKELIAVKGKAKDQAFQERQQKLSTWEPNPNTIDELFIKYNRLPLCDIRFQFPVDEDEEDEQEKEEGISTKNIESSKKLSQKESKKADTASETGSLMSKISYDGPSDPITTDKIVNGFKLRWIQPKYDENMNLIWRKKSSNR